MSGPFGQQDLGDRRALQQRLDRAEPDDVVGDFIDDARQLAQRADGAVLPQEGVRYFRTHRSCSGRGVLQLRFNPDGSGLLRRLCLDVVAVTTIQTPLCALFGIDVPIVQAPIGSWPELSAAVSNAGGLGMLGLSWDDPSEVRRLIRETRNLTAARRGA